MSKNDLSNLEEVIQLSHRNIDMIKNELKKIIVGQDDILEILLIGLISEGHILLEGYPGLAKTLIIETLAKILDIGFKRIQFTPDLLPSDITGSLMYNQKTGEFVPEKGPIFTNFLMADEINRAPAKVQSALLECMQEKKVTIGNFTYKLEEPFLVMATQNPIEQEGTYELPEAQKDRFMLKALVSYPTKDQELEIINRIAISSAPNIKKLINKEEILSWRQIAKNIFVDERIKEYAVNIVFASREPEKNNLNHIKGFIRLGASPRASIYLITAAKAKALLDKRTFVIPEDIYNVCHNILQHRLILSYEAMAESINTNEVIDSILKKIKIP